MNLEVDTGEMGYDWLDDKGFQWVQGGRPRRSATRSGSHGGVGHARDRWCTLPGVRFYGYGLARD